jgi:hypothetical protein
MGFKRRDLERHGLGRCVPARRAWAADEQAFAPRGPAPFRKLGDIGRDRPYYVVDVSGGGLRHRRLIRYGCCLRHTNGFPDIAVRYGTPLTPYSARRDRQGDCGLRGEETKDLRFAVQAACRTKAKLRMLVDEDCGKDYDDIVSDNVPFSEAVYTVIKAADSGDWLEDFVTAVRKCAPDSRKLLRWVAQYRPDSRHPPGMVPAAATSLELMDSANFDLEEVRKVIREALKSSSRVVGFTVTYPEAKFLEKLLNRLEYRLGAQSRTPLSLMLDDDLADSIAQVCSHRAVLEVGVNVLVRVEASGAESAIIENFWMGVRDALSASRGRLVLVFVGNRSTSFPPEFITLPPPAFRCSDVENWTEDLISRRKDWSANPAELANLGDSWAKWLCEKAYRHGQPGNVLVSRLLYTHMDESLIDFRNAPEPGQFRVMIESWS